MVILNYPVFLPKGCFVGFFFAQLLENKFIRNSPIHRGVTAYVLQTKTVNVAGPIVLDLNSLLHDENSFFLSDSDDSTESASECISIKFSGSTCLFQGVTRFEVLNSGIAVDVSSGMRRCVVGRVVLDV
jgi:hypothetical protein